MSAERKAIISDWIMEAEEIVVEHEAEKLILHLDHIYKMLVFLFNSYASTRNIPAERAISIFEDLNDYLTELSGLDHLDQIFAFLQAEGTSLSDGESILELPIFIKTYLTVVRGNVVGRKRDITRSDQLADQMINNVDLLIKALNRSKR